MPASGSSRMHEPWVRHEPGAMPAYSDTAWQPTDRVPRALGRPRDIGFLVSPQPPVVPFAGIAFRRSTRGGRLAQSLSNEQLHHLARHGAEARLKELEAEIAAIRAAFPDLAGTYRRGRPRRPTSRGAVATHDARPRRRRRNRMSAAARKAVSDRMKKYWAGRRAEKGGR